MSTQKYVLIVDDDARNRKLVETLLRAAGHEVRCAGSGADALAAVAAAAPELILLDLMMPGMDGFEVARRLKADPSARNIPIVMVTALDDASSRARLAAAGVSQVLVKPVDRWALNACMDKLLGTSP
ncbi:MAG: response regulator [Sterolibacterium sp.]